MGMVTPANKQRHADDADKSADEEDQRKSILL